MEQKYYEIIIVDDASTDNGLTWEMILEYERKYPELIVAIQSEVNRRQGGARNLGISHARGDYIAFIDDDDYYLPHTLDFALSAALHYSADLVEFDSCSEFNGERYDAMTLNEIEAYSYDIDTKEKRSQFILQDHIEHIGNCWNKLYKSSVIRQYKIRFCENCFYEEPSFIYPFLFCTSRYCKIEHILYVYVRHPKQTMGTLMAADASKYDNINTWMQSYDWFQSYLKNGGGYYDEIEILFIYWLLYSSMFFIKNNFNQQIKETELSYLQNYMNEKFRVMKKIHML